MKKISKPGSPHRQRRRSHNPSVIRQKAAKMMSLIGWSLWIVFILVVCVMSLMDALGWRWSL